MHDYNAAAAAAAAVETSAQAATSEAGTAIALAREAELALTLGRQGEARELVRQAHALASEHAYVVAIGALVALLDGRTVDARNAFAATLRRDPQDAKALFGYGLAEIRLGKLQAGYDRLQEAHASDPGSALILTYLGRAQFSLGQAQAASASWQEACRLDPRDPMPWLYLAQLELAAGLPQAARGHVREAMSRLQVRAVYRGEDLLREDDQLLRAHLAEVQRQTGAEALAFLTLNGAVDAIGAVGQASAQNLRNQAELLQGRRFAESARRSLLLQSLFEEAPGTRPASMDIYGDGAGMTGVDMPQRGFVSALSTGHASYNHYDELFVRHPTLEAEFSSASQGSRGEQLRAGIGNDSLGIGLGHVRFVSAGWGPHENLDNRVLQATVQWRPAAATQLFVTCQNFDSDWGAVFYPVLPWALRTQLADSSVLTRLGLRHDLGEAGDGRQQVRALLTRQDSTQNFHADYSHSAVGALDGAELQYRHSGSGYATQWGLQHISGRSTYAYMDGMSGGYHLQTQQAYATWQQRLGPHWQLEGMLGWRELSTQNVAGGASTHLRGWLPHVGVVYAPDQLTHLRFAAWKTLATPLPGDASLAPPSLAGLLLARPNDGATVNGQWVRTQALAADRQLNEAWLLSAELRHQRNHLPVIVSSPSDGLDRQDLYLYRHQQSTLGLYWQPATQPWAVALSWEQERQYNDPRTLELDSLLQQRLRSGKLDLRWFPQPDWTLRLALSHNRVRGALATLDMTTWETVAMPYRRSFNQLDAELAWKFADASRLIVGVRNAGDAASPYVDLDRYTPRFAKGRLLYANVSLAW